jgi:polyhydroxyalkanoate synthesis regulator phasin
MGLGDLVQKAAYLGIGLASYASEKMGEKVGELGAQVQKLADEMVERGEMTTEEARRFVDEMMAKAQSTGPETVDAAQPTEPRRIEILDDDEPAATSASPVDEMRRKVTELQDELQRLRQEKR